MEFVASVSCGKDSLAMILRIMDEHMPLTKAVMYDTGMEFKAIYNNLEKVTPIIEKYGAKMVVLKPESDFLFDMLIKPVCKGTDKEHYGFDWCGGCTRWRTSGKVQTINRFLSSLGNYQQYIGIASDEPNRVKREGNKIYPLVSWNMTEKECLNYCYGKGWNWNEATPVTESGFIDLYKILDRVSCWCCKNKNLKELRNIYHYLPDYWCLLKGMQSRINRPFKGNKTIFDLQMRFDDENAQITLDDYLQAQVRRD